MEQPTAGIDRELESAFADLRRTLSKANYKIKRTEERLAPRALVAHHRWSIIGVAGALGFLLGIDSQHRVDWLAAGTLLGGAVMSVIRSAEGETERWRSGAAN